MSVITAIQDVVIVGTGPFLSAYRIDKDEKKNIFNWELINKENIKYPEGLEEKCQKQGNEIVILCIHAGIRDGKKTVVVGTNEKLMHLIELNDELNGRHVISSYVPKAPTSCRFDKQMENVIIGDRSGDVHKMELSSGNVEEIAGAISMVLDVELTPSGKRLLMADRDEKIRVFRYPQSYVIDSYLMGHTEYVKTVVAEDDNLVWSAGGDGTLKKWNVETRKCLVDVKIIEQEKVGVRKMARNSDGVIYIVVDKSSKILAYDGDKCSNIECDNELIDVVGVGEKQMAVLTRENILIIEGSMICKKIETFVDVRESLAKTNDPIDSYFKNVAFNNQEEYAKRKEEKFSKLEKQRVGKRKATEIAQ